MILGGLSVGKDLNSGINPRILLQGDEAAAYKQTLNMSFLGLPRCPVSLSPPGSKKSDDRKYVCVGRLRCKNLGTCSLRRTFFFVFCFVFFFWFYGFHVFVFFVLRYS